MTERFRPSSREELQATALLSVCSELIKIKRIRWSFKLVADQPFIEIEEDASDPGLDKYINDLNSLISTQYINVAIGLQKKLGIVNINPDFLGRLRVIKFKKKGSPPERQMTEDANKHPFNNFLDQHVPISINNLGEISMIHLSLDRPKDELFAAFFLSFRIPNGFFSPDFSPSFEKITFIVIEPGKSQEYIDSLSVYEKTTLLSSLAVLDIQTVQSVKDPLETSQAFCFIRTKVTNDPFSKHEIDLPVVVLKVGEQIKNKCIWFDGRPVAVVPFRN